MSRGKKWILRGLAVLGILCALGAALVFGLSGYVVLSTRQQFRTLEDTPPEAVDCILVLGCGVYADGTPTPMLSDRLTRGVELYQAGWADKLLMSGPSTWPGPWAWRPGAWLPTGRTTGARPCGTSGRSWPGTRMSSGPSSSRSPPT